MGASQASSEGVVMVDVASGDIGVDAAVDLARRALLATGSSTELRGEMTDLAGDHVAWVLVGEKYFLRNSSYASLTVLVSGDARSSRVQALAVDRVPTLIVLKDGAEMARCTGFQPEEILSLWLDAKLEA